MQLVARTLSALGLLLVSSLLVTSQAGCSSSPAGTNPRGTVRADAGRDATGLGDAAVDSPRSTDAGGRPEPPGDCTISGAPTGGQPAGYQASLTLDCVTGGVPAENGYVWTGMGAAGKTTRTVGPILVETTTTFTATASNGGGTSTPPASATVTIDPNASIACMGFPATLLLDIAWDTPGQGASFAYTYNNGGFAAKDALVVRFTTPAVPVPPTGKVGVASIGFVEYMGSPTQRSGSLSTIPCDFTTGITGQPGLSSVFANDVGPKVYFTLDYKQSGFLELQPSTTYYLNADNYGGSTLTCSNPTCDVKVTLTKQPGT